jgi:uncharacterized protein
VSATTIVAVRVTARARRDEIVGWRGDVLLMRVKAPPVEGRANDAVIRLLADSLGVTQSAIQIVSGESSRDKRLIIGGLTLEGVKRCLAKSPGNRGEAG